MGEELITKKELLELTGISYGALYRWKRMKLLPDEWFIRKSTSSGHETCLPREKVLKRVAEIQKLKETLNLEEIAQRFQPAKASDLKLTANEVVATGIASRTMLRQYASLTGHSGSFRYKELLKLYVFSTLLTKGTISSEEALSAAEAAAMEHVPEAEQEAIGEPLVWVLRKYGIAFCITTGDMQHLILDKDTVLIEKLQLNALQAEIDARLRRKGVRF